MVNIVAQRQTAVELDLSSEIYRENLAFWEKAWSGVTRPYKQLPQLSYVPRIPADLKERGVNKVLDLGCGSGWLSIYLCREGFQVTGVDVSAQAIKLGKIWAREDGHSIDFQVSDIETMEFEVESFDAVVANSIFEHFPLNMSRDIADRIFKMLKPGGVFIGCFDNVGGGPGEYFELEDGTHVYTDPMRKGMLLRRYQNQELHDLFKDFSNITIEEVDAGSNYLTAVK
ncbi:MAG: class I SAM-dependent methyltransferase [Candidatus Melainabacteria bacterium]|jgi:SAM-dependent methyltransferase|uniref:Class I SAM-dependent methyltransferase n=1 Tax=Candidatus Obscuribacter phosphatis TaxID=1906157 RepID=A0A8J7PJF7_9BACT|nr:class I SAM-dependent methyltransferase [Candidatus Obscuribacter phosphatis]MCA0314784.1 class I SAM-dependent methyltransferase [Candidatus Melainabacteria bacterium]